MNTSTGRRRPGGFGVQTFTVKQSSSPTTDVVGFNCGQMFVNHDVDQTFPSDSRDILVLHLSTPILRVAPLPLRATLPAVGDTCTGVGFGRHQNDDGSLSRKVK